MRVMVLVTGYSRNESGELMFPSGPAQVNSSRSGEEHRA
jgi:hypothetical protein